MVVIRVHACVGAGLQLREAVFARTVNVVAAGAAASDDLHRDAGLTAQTDRFHQLVDFAVRDFTAVLPTLGV